jgi:rhodanese-related sulfurtransferase
MGIDKARDKAPDKGTIGKSMTNKCNILPSILPAAFLLLSSCGQGPAVRGRDATGHAETIEAMYRKYKRAFPDVPDVRADELVAAADENTVLVDVRAPAEQAVSMIPGAVTRREFERNPAKYKGRRIVPYCTIGYRSGLYARDLRNEGWDAQNLSGSILAWIDAGGEVTSATGTTRSVHVFGSEWDLLPPGYEAVLFTEEEADEEGRRWK